MRIGFMLALIFLVGVSHADPASIEAGKTLYGQTCIACHGANGKGAIPGVADLTKTNGALAKSDEVLFTNIKEGLQTPGRALTMPPKGGNPTLSDKDVEALLAYLREAFGTTE